jgi:hypothetical protein
MHETLASITYVSMRQIGGWRLSAFGRGLRGMALTQKILLDVLPALPSYCWNYLSHGVMLLIEKIMSNAPTSSELVTASPEIILEAINSWKMTIC